MVFIIVRMCKLLIWWLVVPKHISDSFFLLPSFSFISCCTTFFSAILKWESFSSPKADFLFLSLFSVCQLSFLSIQFLYEAGFGSNQSSLRNGIIGVTQPRRVAVLSTAKRVAFELGLRLGKEVGFQVRHDKMIGDSCSIKFMTDGILLREVQVCLSLICVSFSLRKTTSIINSLQKALFDQQKEPCPG